MNLIGLTFLGAAMFTAHTATAQVQTYDTTPCVQYYVVGLAECAPEEPSKTVVIEPAVPPSPTAVVTAPPPPEISPLDTKIDEFIEGYGKPPREFVAFHLEPSLENALTWVRTYNTLLQRNLDITDAWTQAENIYLDNVKQGVDITANLPAFAEGTGLPPVPDFGNPIERFKPAVAELSFLEQPQSQENSLRIGAFANDGFSGNSFAGGEIGLTNPLTLSSAQVSNQLTPPFNPVVGVQTPTQAPFNPAALSAPQAPTTSLQPQPNASGKIEIDYYFSAQCPFCAKFEPEFQQLITEFKDQLQVTCVDVSPHSRNATNILGKVDCQWRPGQPGEAKELGIRATPSLIIRRGNGQPLERVSGYVPVDRIRTHLFNKL